MQSPINLAQAHHVRKNVSTPSHEDGEVSTDRNNTSNHFFVQTSYVQDAKVYDEGTLRLISLANENTQSTKSQPLMSSPVVNYLRVLFSIHPAIEADGTKTIT